MDLLKSLNLEDLPEQQTRTSHLMESHPDFQLNLGFDACCACGKTTITVQCDSCYRVRYCSKACREEDSDGSKRPPRNDGDEGEEEHALGHSAVICSILRLCNDDEAVEKEKEGGSASTLDESKKRRAIDRIVSEFESYPATLANIIIDGPCYQDVLYRRNGGTLTIHVVGASYDSELWSGHPDPLQEQNVFQGYAEALAELAETRNLKAIQLHFVGPECPTTNIDKSVPIPGVDKQKSMSELLVQTHCGNYTANLMNSVQIPSPDIVVFFNPGFTCPDYDWEEALSCIKKGTPMLMTTNTELEGVADVQYLLDRELIKDLPPGLGDIMGIGGSDGDQTMSDNDSFFSVNPYSGSRVRQSGTMANDLYVKSRWILGSTIGGSSPTVEPAKSAKKAKITGSGNTKRANPALV